ncbi:hypothetical protein [Tunturiibacter lichenicola]|uniref:hypothetical protein n=1 Tax=Tunturiibacter lichenicola TaxID=2051959 RepID=UPI0021B22B29|nr:hypothetical protein [Edaphobacter lichenicola]
MRQRINRQGVAKLLLFVTAITLSTMSLPAWPQQEPEDERGGGVSFAGGQMVRGTVTAIAADHLTVKTEAGDIYQVAISANTRVTKERLPLKLTDIKAGDGVGAMGVLDPATKTVHAVFVGVIDAEQIKKAREGMGKVYITGKVTAIDLDGLKLTVLRPDGVSQVIGVDEQTSFKRGGRRMATLASGAGVGEVGSPAAERSNGANSSGNSSGESITFADVKVGDSVAGRGALKNGVFVPSELGVMDAAMVQQRRRRAAEAAGAIAPAASTTPAVPAKPAPPQ